ncbi:RHS repeat-associated core domain-containing protein [Streptomyces sp. NPDC059850]|uniref:RHS repeat-associated core domain-containing protein n=1 Tax=Streptomyces sp. NPDC059850 TaxID=3346970 RepID=UPI0036563195
MPLRFPGQYADPETGLHYNYFRHYDPETARYVTPDPLGLQPALNHHGYVRNSLGWLDPLGLKGCKGSGESPDKSSLKFEPSPKHGKMQRGDAAPEPTNPQAALERSISFNPNTTRRISADHETGEFSVFDETHNGTGIYHGHVRTWNDLSQQMQSAPRKVGLVTAKGKIVDPGS